MNKSDFIGFKELPSTNGYALSNIEGLNDRGVIFAKTQSSGRGRLKRSWVSNNPKNLYFSIILKPTEDINCTLPLSNLTQYTSVIVSKKIEKYGVQAQIKWPNDVLVNNKKIAGILAEASIRGNFLKGLVIGVGINLNSTKEEMDKIDQPATSLNLETSKEFNEETFLKELINDFFKDYDKFLEDGFEMIKSDYIKRCLFLNKEIKVSDLEGVYPAIPREIKEDGSLIIEVNNERKDIRIGDLLC